MQQESLGLNCRPMENVELTQTKISVKQEYTEINDDKVKIKREILSVDDNNINNVKTELLANNSDYHNQGLDRSIEARDESYRLDNTKNQKLQELVDFARNPGPYPAMQFPAYRTVGPGPPNAYGFPRFYPPPGAANSTILDRSRNSPKREKHHGNEVAGQQNHHSNDDNQTLYHNNRQPTNITSDLYEPFRHDYRNHSHDFHHGKTPGYSPVFRTPLEMAYLNQQQQQQQASQQQNNYRSLCQTGRQRNKWSYSALRFLQPTAVSLEKGKKNK